MNRRDALKIIGFSILVTIFFIQPVNGAEKSFMIKIATLAPEGSSWMKTLNKLNTEVMRKTENKVRFKIYPGGVLGDEKDMLRKMQIGQIQGAGLTTGGLSVLFKEIDVFQIPFLFQNYGEVDYVLTKMDSFFKKGFEDNGYILLGWSEAGFIYLMSNTPISSVSDLKKVKVWIWQESPMAKAIFDEAGVAAIPLSVPDVLVGLQTGLVDVVYVPPTGAISLQWFTKVKYITDVPLAYIAGGIVVRKDVFKRLPQPFQNILIETFQRYLGQLKAVTRNENREAIKVMMKHGVKIVTPPQDQVDEFRRLSDKAMDHLGSQTFSKKVLDEVSFHLENYQRGVK
ncbi:MAG: TRAP transporter substrate-binding protein DctP [Deltaproteobacteria bacterium]|nr:TRAP transporter substrate-binding protein DctP [Deltaproteobacteria bacterium]